MEKYIRLNDSSVSQQWVEEISDKNPALALTDKAGIHSGLFRFPPGRLAFPELFESSRNEFNNINNADSYSTLVLFPSCAKLDVVHEKAIALMNEHFSESFDGELQSRSGVKYPFQDQKSKAFRGFTPGCQFIRASTRFPPTLYGRDRTRIDLRRNAYSLADSFYAGAWVILVGKFSVYKIRRNKGINIYMQSALFVGDDESLLEDYSFCFDDVQIPS